MKNNNNETFFSPEDTKKAESLMENVFVIAVKGSKDEGETQTYFMLK